MKQLSKLSPAETLLVLKERNVNIKELLKVTFMDLLLKRVLKTIEVQKRSNQNDPVRNFIYVVVGVNFKNYQPLAHESVFLAPFQKSIDIKVLFRHLVQMGFQNAKSETYFKKLIGQNSNIERCFSRNFIQSVFGGFSITKEGCILKNELELEISELEILLPSLLLNEHQKALNIFKIIKGNIFLLKNFEFDLLKEIDQELLVEMNKLDTNNTDLACSGLAWGMFHDYSEGFESGCSSGDSGCGGSGCSGCGGGD